MVIYTKVYIIGIYTLNYMNTAINKKIKTLINLILTY